MNNVVTFFPKDKFTLESAQHLIPTIRNITERANNNIKHMFYDANINNEELQKRIDAEFKKWQEKMKKLGVEGKGFWTVDFDNGKGYYCWKYPETKLEHTHGYSEGLLHRNKIG